MILRSVCNTCFQRYEVTFGPDAKVATAMLSQLMDKDGQGACPRQCGGKINLTNDAAIDSIGQVLREPLHLNIVELFQAVMGMPLPDEVPAALETTKALLLAHRVSDVRLEDAAGRLYLHEIVLDNGCTLHLCAGGRGAQVLKVTRPTETP